MLTHTHFIEFSYISTLLYSSHFLLSFQSVFCRYIHTIPFFGFFPTFIPPRVEYTRSSQRDLLALTQVLDKIDGTAV